MVDAVTAPTPEEVRAGLSTAQRAVESSATLTDDEKAAAALILATAAVLVNDDYIMNRFQQAALGLYQASLR